MGQDILRRAHPDAVNTMKHWLTILQARWEEVTSWANQRGEKIGHALNDIHANSELLDNLTAWLTSAENALAGKDQQQLPENIPIVEQLLQDHQVCS